MALPLAADLQFSHRDRSPRGRGGAGGGRGGGRARRAGGGALDACVSATMQFHMRERCVLMYVMCFYGLFAA